MIKELMRKMILWAIGDKITDLVDLSKLFKDKIEDAENRISILANSIDKRLESKINHNDLRVSRLETLSDFLKATDDKIAKAKNELKAFVLEAINDNEDIAFEVMRDFVEEEIIRCLNKRDEETVPNIPHLSLTDDNLKVIDKKEAVYIQLEATEEVDFFRLVNPLPIEHGKIIRCLYNPNTQERMLCTIQGLNSHNEVISLRLKRGMDDTKEKPILTQHKLLVFYK